ncbi:MAG: hypothetical protein J1E41_00900 [Ruminococcus sp.]|nr:hypothetical protein [Ruminococcus sp.]
MNVDFKGYGENVATFICDDNSLKAGDFVKMKDNNTVCAATSGSDIIGCCVGVRDDYAAVQLSGYIEAKANAKITLGLTGISVSSADTVQSSTSASKHLVVYSDENTVGFIL